VTYDHEAALAEARREHEAELGIPRDADARARYFERQAALARSEAHRETVARAKEELQQIEHDAIAAEIDHGRRALARAANVVGEADQELAKLSARERREQAAATRRELAETKAEIDARLRPKLARIRHRLAFKLPVTRGEHELLERYGGTH